MTIKEIDQALEEGQSLKAIAQAYSEIANLKIKRIRSAVERNRLFFDEISKIYGIVKTLAIKRGVAIQKPKKRLCILLTSNYRFYGNINSSLINYFVGSTRELADVDKIIIGKGAIDYFRVARILTNEQSSTSYEQSSTSYKEVILKDDMPTDLELANLVNLSADYNQVLVFYSKFISLLTQKATFTDVTAMSFYLNSSVESQDREKGENLIQFIFEPQLPKMLKFFDNQIITLLLEATFLESELGRTASRFISMDQAETASIKFIKEYEKLKSFAKRSLDNNKILENFASLANKRKIFKL